MAREMFRLSQSKGNQKCEAQYERFVLDREENLITFCFLEQITYQAVMIPHINLVVAFII